MAKEKKEIDLVERPMDAVENTLSKAESLFQTYQKQITYTVGGLIAVVALAWGYQEFIVKPAEEEAQLALYPAQDVFAQDSLNLALNGNAEFMGFAEIADEYGSTNAGNLANYYAGLCHLGLGQAEEAIDYLEEFDGDGTYLDIVATGAIGDAFADLKQPKEAEEYYAKAASLEANEFLTPFFLSKAALAAELNSDLDAALAYTKRIKADFPTSAQGANADALIAYYEAKLEAN
ncbi:MAG: tetratricopeptide repeat protein [Bacteroidota bacterium]